MPRRVKPVVSATSTVSIDGGNTVLAGASGLKNDCFPDLQTSYWVSSNCSGIIPEFCTSTSMSIMVMEWRRLSTPLIVS